MKKILSLILTAALLLSLAVPAVAEERSGGTLIALLVADPGSFNPDIAQDDAALFLGENIFSKLVKFDYAGNLMPDLAQSWDVSADGLTYTFHLADTKWHDGEPCTADDVVWSFDFIKQYGFSADSFADATVTVVDPLTVQFTLTKPDAALLYNLSYYGATILPKHLYDGQDYQTCDAAINHPIGTGAFKFVEYTPGVSVTIEANLDYFGHVPELDTVIESIIPDTSTAIQAFYAGELDYLATYVPATELAGLRASGANVYEEPFASRYYVATNMREGRITANLAVRQAIAYGVDRQAILDKALAGSGSIAEGFAPAAIAWAYNGEDILPERDVEKAISILEEAGYTKDADGYYLTLDAPTMPEFVTMTNVFKDSMKDIGINVVVDSLEVGAWVEKVFAGEFDLSILSGYHGPDASGMALRVGTNGALNFLGYSNEEVDADYAAGAAVTDVEERAKFYKHAQKILSQELPIIPLCEVAITDVAAANVLGTPLTAPNVCTVGELNYVHFAK